MKNRNSHGFFFFFFFFFFFISFLFILLLFSSHSASARFPPSKHGIEETHKKISYGSMVQSGDSWPDFPHVKREKDEEEVEEEEGEKRKMMLEAHLDYVYTQHENP
ncbi:hypothetical protein IC582_009327 [Cucumis melo]